jgi:serine/threonine protein kinase
MSSTGSGSELRAIAEERVGTTLRERWQLESVLGVGGMAAVYAARHRNGSRVAIKMLHPMLSHHEAVRTRFLAEGRAANAVEHDGVVHVLDDDVTPDGCAFQVMELLEGDTLDALGRQRGRAHDVSTVVDLIDQLLDALAAAHRVGIVHRDIKPQNVFVTRAGQVKVLDFGIARVHEPTDGGQQTRTGMLMGTPAFMAPEQALGRWRLVDGQSDVWAVGASMYWLLTGKLVHIGETFQEVLVQAARDRAPSLAALLPGADPGLVAIVDKALAFDKALRWKDAREMQAALRGWRARASVVEAPLPTTLPLHLFVSGEDSTVGARRTTEPLVVAADTGPITLATQLLEAPLHQPAGDIETAPRAPADPSPRTRSRPLSEARPERAAAQREGGQTSVPFSTDATSRKTRPSAKLGIALLGAGILGVSLLFGLMSRVSGEPDNAVAAGAAVPASPLRSSGPPGAPEAALADLPGAGASPTVTPSAPVPTASASVAPAANTLLSAHTATPTSPPPEPPAAVTRPASATTGASPKRAPKATADDPKSRFD